MEAATYKFNVDSFWEAEKIAFNPEIQKVEIGSARPSIFQLSLAQDNKARQHATAIGQLECHRISLVATPSYGALATAKQKSFNIPNPADCRVMLNTIYAELHDWTHKKDAPN